MFQTTNQSGITETPWSGLQFFAEPDASEPALSVLLNH